MTILVNTNTSALTTQRHLATVTNQLSTSYERLSSGYRINRAADDAAGLQISGPLTSQIQGLAQASRNANDAISVAQVAEGAMDEMIHAIQRMRVLAIQAENGINTVQDKEAIQAEIAALKAELDRTAQSTSIGGKTLLDGSQGQLNFLVGAYGGESIALDLTQDFRLTSLGLDGIDVVNGVPELIMSQIDDAIQLLSAARGLLGAQQNRLEATLRDLSVFRENVSEARSRIVDTDYAKETTEQARTQIMQQSSTTILVQANQRPQAALSVLVS